MQPTSMAVLGLPRTPLVVASWCFLALLPTVTTSTLARNQQQKLQQQATQQQEQQRGRQRIRTAMGKRQVPPPVPVPVPVQVPSVTLVPLASAGVGDPQVFAHELPYYPAGQPEMMFLSRCTHFLNDALERANYNPRLTVQFLPKCRWSMVECATLEADLLSRFPTGGVPAP